MKAGAWILFLSILWTSLSFANEFQTEVKIPSILVKIALDNAEPGIFDGSELVVWYVPVRLWNSYVCSIHIDERSRGADIFEPLRTSLDLVESHNGSYLHGAIPSLNTRSSDDTEESVLLSV